MGTHQPTGRGQLRTAAEERRGLQRKVVRQPVQRTQRREAARNAGRAELRDPLRPGQVAQLVHAQVLQEAPVPELVGDEVGARTGHQHLSAVRQCPHSRAPAERLTGVAAVLADLRVPGVHRHPNHRVRLRPGANQVQGEARAVDGPGEDHHQALDLVVGHHTCAVMPDQPRADHPVQPGHRRGRGVGKDEGDRAARQSDAHRTIFVSNRCLRHDPTSAAAPGTNITRKGDRRDRLRPDRHITRSGDVPRLRTRVE